MKYLKVVVSNESRYNNFKCKIGEVNRLFFIRME